MVYNLLKLVLLLPVATLFFQSQLFTSTDPKALSPTFTGCWTYKLPTCHWLCRYRFVFFFTSLSPPSRDRFVGAPHLLSRQRTTNLFRRVRGPALMSARLYPHRCWGSAPSPRRSPPLRGPHRDDCGWYMGPLNSFLINNYSCRTRWPSAFFTAVFLWPTVHNSFSKSHSSTKHTFNLLLLFIL